MIRDLSKDELEPRASTNETELTIGGGVLLALSGGLLLLCAVCFGIGYMVGHRSSSEQDAALTMPGSKPTVAAAPTGSGSKPAATKPQAQASVDLAMDEGGVTPPVRQGPAVQEAVNSSQAQVKPALDEAAGGAQSTPVLNVQPAMTQVQGWMVQIAAVTHAEDAEVLVDALRKRGYPVTVRREVSDNLVHIRVGPFATRNDANAMQQKLFSDGYNALVQP